MKNSSTSRNRSAGVRLSATALLIPCTKLRETCSPTASSKSSLRAKYRYSVARDTPAASHTALIDSCAAPRRDRIAIAPSRIRSRLRPFAAGCRRCDDAGGFEVRAIEPAAVHLPGSVARALKDIDASGLAEGR